MLFINKPPFWLSVVFLIFNTYAQPPCNPNDNSALLRLNTTAQNWNSSTDCCTWDGVECDNITGHVVGLEIILRTNITSNNSLFSLRHLEYLVINPSPAPNDDTRHTNDGTLSHSAFKALTRNLTNLEELGMYSVDMSSVPLASLANLSSSLTTLVLYSCSMHGELPRDVFRSLPLLEVVVLPFNHLSGQLPQFIFSQENIKTVALHNNNFSSQLPEICSHSYAPQNISVNCVVGKLPSSLNLLSLAWNFFHGPLPSWIYVLPEIEWLEFHNNHLSGEIGDFQTPSLTALFLENNKLCGIIPKSLFQNKKQLLGLDLSSNNLTGNVDFEDVFVKLKKLRHLGLSSNNFLFSGSHASLSTNLSHLGLSSCNLSEFPSFFKSSRRLKWLDLSNNQFHGSVPRWLWDTSKSSLSHLNLSHNSLTYFPLLPWKIMEILDLHSNSISGPLPTLSPLMSVFMASRNNFSGVIPNSICNLSSLNALDLSYNGLTGYIPQCIGTGSQQLRLINLQRNKLSGTIPSIFLPGIWLQYLNLNRNQLIGVVPRSLVICTYLQFLDLGNNHLNDTFPDWLESLPVLQVLILNSNNFRGMIGNPRNKSSFSLLRIMDLSQNSFTGALPAIYFDNLEAMKISTEKYQTDYMGTMGYIYYEVSVTMKGYDSELQKIITLLTTIDFSRNYFTGTIPESIGKLKALKSLNLSHNVLTSVIPSILGSLSNLESLDLSSNQLVGKIPHGLAGITFLQKLNLSHNNLEGPIPQGSQFNTFGNESFVGNLNLCGFPLSKTCGVHTKQSTPSTEKLEDEGDSNDIFNGFLWKIVMAGFASGLVIGISIGYMLLYSNGKLNWLSERILLELAIMVAHRRTKRSRNTHRRS